MTDNASPRTKDYDETATPLATETLDVAPRISIGRLLEAAAIGICGLFILLIGGFLWYQWAGFSSAQEAVATFDTFRAALVAMERVSAERGPTNSVLGEDAPIPYESREALQSARSATNDAIRALADDLATARCPACASGLATLGRLESDLAVARANADRLASLPRTERSAPAVDDAVIRLVEVVPQFNPVVDATELIVVRGDASALDVLQMARLAAMLRDQAGLLGSCFTGALTARRPLTQAEQFAVERTYGHIEQLRLFIEAHGASNPALPHDAFSRVRSQYFRDGLDYVGVVRVVASSETANGMPTPRQFAARYVPLMRPILDFRDQMLDRAGAEVRRHRDAVLTKFVATAALGVALIGSLLLIAWLFRWYVIAPFSEATSAIIDIAAGRLPRQIQSRTYRGEIQSLFDAVRVLKANSRRRMRLEQERHALITELTAMAETDALTGLLNRRAFDSRARVLCSLPPVVESMVALILFDIDHFKRINDSWGHASGDLALQQVGELCRATWRAEDIVARIGGEEFVALLETPNRDDALHTVEQFRDRLARLTVPTGQGAGFGFTASFGVVFARHAELTEIAPLLKRADVLLYRAKEAGRNRVEIEPAA